jgi:hypothetical protein
VYIQPGGPKLAKLAGLAHELAGGAEFVRADGRVVLVSHALLVHPGGVVCSFQHATKAYSLKEQRHDFRMY